MRIILSGVGFKTSEPLRAYAEQRVRSWLGHLEHELAVVAVQLVSEDHEGGRRARCRLLARPARGQSLVVEDTSGDVYEAIDGAPERMAKALRIAARRQRSPAPAGV